MLDSIGSRRAGLFRQQFSEKECYERHWDWAGLFRGCDQGFQFENNSLQLIHDAVGFLSLEFVYQGAVVPQRALAFSLKPFPDLFSEFTIVGENRAGVVQLVGRRYQPRVRVGSAEMLEVRLFALAPRRLGSSKHVTAALHDMRHTLAETATDLVKHGDASAVFGDIVKERGDGEIFVASGLKHQTRNTE